MIKTIIFFIISITLFNCNLNEKKSLMLINDINKYEPSNSAVYLTANYSFSKGDAYSASKILDKKIKNPKLLELKAGMVFGLRSRKIK